MAVQGVGQYSQSYLPIQRKSFIEDPSIESAQTIQQSSTAAEAGENGDKQESGFDPESVRTPKVSNPEDFAFDFKWNNQFNLVAASSDTEDIDVEKALDDMHKDTVLEQYKFFVESANLGTDEDGTVRLVQR